MSLAQKARYSNYTVPTTFICRRCSVEKTSGEFPRWNKGLRGFQNTCKPCKAQWERAYRKANPEVHWERDIERYGLTREAYEALLAVQRGVCAICGKRELAKRGRLHIDHNHITKRVRGLLCSNCNTGLGKFREQIAFLEAAIEYLRR